jgi:autoinducer 2 (AI-2) kinase
MSDRILTIDISSTFIKVALLSAELEIERIVNQSIDVLDEDIDGFAKIFDMEQLWNTICLAIKKIISPSTNKDLNIIGISTCAQRIASVFIDRMGKEIYGGPNTDIRGIDSAYIIEDKFSEKELFNITGHTPSLLFTLARILWFREEAEQQFEKIKKILMLDDWLVYRLSGEIVSDPSSAAESQLLDIKKRNWSNEIIGAFKLDPDLFPPIVESGTVIGHLKLDLMKKFNIHQKPIPIIKTGGDTQASLLGMGAIKEADIGISLGTTAPIQLITKKPIFDPKCNYWASCHSIKGTWLVEAHAGNTGVSYNWFKDTFIDNSTSNKDLIIDNYLSQTQPGAFSTLAYLGPEKMNIKNQTFIKRGIFVFPPPQLISTELPKINNFARSVIENIAFGIYENVKALKQFISLKPKLFCGGGMAKSQEVRKVLANVLDNLILTPSIKETSFIGTAMNILKGLDLYPDFKSIINDLLKYEAIDKEDHLVKSYKNIYNEWKSIKNKIDDL